MNKEELYKKEIEVYENSAMIGMFKGAETGGIPIGGALVRGEDEVVSIGYNKRIQEGSPILHGETDAINNAGRLTYETYSKCTMYTTLSPCTMCAGTILLYKIPRVVIADNQNFQESEQWLKDNGVEVVVLDHYSTINYFKHWAMENPRIWNEDIGVDTE